jgi:hypothetical protein
MGLSPSRGLPRLVFVTAGIFVTLSPAIFVTGNWGFFVTPSARLKMSRGSLLMAGHGWRDQCLVLHTMQRVASIPRSIAQSLVARGENGVKRLGGALSAVAGVVSVSTSRTKVLVTADKKLFYRPQARRHGPGGPGSGRPKAHCSMPT